KFFLQNLQMRLFGQIFSEFFVFVVRQKRGNQTFSAVESAPHNIVPAPGSVQKRAEVEQTFARELKLAGFSLVDKTCRVFRADSHYVNLDGFTDLRLIKNREADLIVFVEIAVIMLQITAHGFV